MSRSPEEAREELVMRFMSGELDPASAEGRRLLAEDASLGEELEELRLLERAIEAGSRFELEVLEEAESSEDPAGDALVERVLREQAAGAGSPRPRPNRFGRRAWVVVGLLAATALVATRVHLRRQLLEGDGVTNEGVMGGGDLELYGPKGAVEEYGEFTWEPGAPERGTYRVLVYDATDGRAPLVSSHDLTEPRWTPDEPLEVEHIRWSVEVWSAGGQRVGSSEPVEAWLSSRR